MQWRQSTFVYLDRTFDRTPSFSLSKRFFNISDLGSLFVLNIVIFYSHACAGNALHHVDPEDRNLYAYLPRCWNTNWRSSTAVFSLPVCGNVQGNVGLRFVTDYDAPVRVIAGSLRGTIPRWFEFPADSLLCLRYERNRLHTYAITTAKNFPISPRRPIGIQTFVLVVRSRREPSVQTFKTKVNAKISRHWYAGNLLVTYFRVWIVDIKITN